MFCFVFCAIFGKSQILCRGICVKLEKTFRHFHKKLSPRAPGARLERVARSASARRGLGRPALLWQAACAGTGGGRLRAGALFTAVLGGKQADVNEGWRFHEAQLVDGRFNVTALNWAMIRTVCKIHFLAGLCPPAPSSKRSSPSPSSYAFECNKNWTRHCCALFLLTTITFKRKEKSFGTNSNFFFLILSPKYTL